MTYEEQDTLAVSEETRVKFDTVHEIDLYDHAESLTYEQVRDLMGLAPQDRRFDG